MAYAHEGWVEMTLWHNQIDGLLASMLGFLVGLTKGVLMVAAVLLVVLILLGLELNWPVWAIILVSLYALLECLGRCLPVWFPKNFAATPTAIICVSGLIHLDSQPKPIMIRWASVLNATYFFHVDPHRTHLAVDYRNVVGGSSTIILQGEDSKRRLVDLYESIRARIEGVG